MNLKLGTPVKIHARLRRDDTVWVREVISPSLDGIVVGYRVKNNGKWEHEFDEWSGRNNSYYQIVKAFKAVLVATSLYKSHVVAYPQDIEEVK